MITSIGGVQLSRRTVIMLARAEHEAAAEQRAAEQARRQREETAARNLQRYYQEHGEWPSETMARAQQSAARREAAEQRQRQIARTEALQAYQAQWLMQGNRPRTHAEILETARLFP